MSFRSKFGAILAYRRGIKNICPKRNYPAGIFFISQYLESGEQAASPYKKLSDIALIGACLTTWLYEIPDIAFHTKTIQIIPVAGPARKPWSHARMCVIPALVYLQPTARTERRYPHIKTVRDSQTETRTAIINLMQLKAISRTFVF